MVASPVVAPSVGKDKDPWNRCQFQCRLCETIFTDRRNVKSHIVMAHKLSYQDDLAQFGDPELPTAKWQCLMCGSETRHARNNIYIHLRDCHSMTCDQYAAQHGMPGMERTEDGSVSWPGPGEQGTPGAHQVVAGGQEQGGGLVSTQFSSKWNKCKFQCPVCDKISNEKRHIRTHTMSAHGMSLDVLEAENGDCEFHTEYFFCAVCHAEVKHCHRNILMHLQRSHNLTCAEYEAKFGDVDTSANAATVEEAGFGQHFLITDGGGNLLGGQSRSQTTPMSGSKSRKSLGEGGVVRNVSESGRLVRGTGSIACEDCGRMFSTHSNKERHRREHCANMKLATMAKAGLGMGHSVDSGHSPVTVKREAVEDAKEDLRCWVEGCGEEFVRSVHLKRHLTGTHHIQNPLLEARDMVVVKAEIEEEKVPPLKIKLNQNDSSKSDKENVGHDDMKEDVNESMEDEVMDNVEIIDAHSIAEEDVKLEENTQIGIVIDESNKSLITDEDEGNRSEVAVTNIIHEETDQCQ